MLQNAAKYHSNSFYRFWIIKGKPTEGGKISFPTQIRVKNEILSVTNSANTADLNPKINEVKNKVFNNSNLATSTALSAIENKIPNVGYLVKKTDYSRIY